MYILPPSISKKIEGYRWQSFTPPAAGKSRRFRGLICHRRSHSATRPILVMNLLKSPTGHVTNISAQTPILNVKDENPLVEEPSTPKFTPGPAEPGEPEPAPPVDPDPPEPDPDLPSPPKPSSFSAINWFLDYDIELRWHYPLGYDRYPGYDYGENYPLHKQTHIYRSTTRNFDDAIVIATTEGHRYVDRNLSPGRYWYWIQWESKEGVLGPLSYSENSTVHGDFLF